MPKLAGSSKRRSKTDPRKLRPLNLRTTESTRIRLEEAARGSGRSLTQEVERRLERSFDRDDELGGGRTAALLRSLADCKCTLAVGEGDDWLENYHLFHIVVDAWLRLLQQRAPQMSDQQQADLSWIRDLIEEADATDRQRLIDLMASDARWPREIRDEFAAMAARGDGK